MANQHCRRRPGIRAEKTHSGQMNSSARKKERKKLKAASLIAEAVGLGITVSALRARKFQVVKDLIHRNSVLVEAFFGNNRGNYYSNW